MVSKTKSRKEDILRVSKPIYHCPDFQGATSVLSAQKRLSESMHLLTTPKLSSTNVLCRKWKCSLTIFIGLIFLCWYLFCCFFSLEEPEPIPSVLYIYSLLDDSSSVEMYPVFQVKHVSKKPTPFLWSFCHFLEVKTVVILESSRFLCNQTPSLMGE